MVKIISWNINGLQSFDKRLNDIIISINNKSEHERQPESVELKDLFNTFNVDILCFQETKITRSKIQRKYACIPGYDAYFAFSQTRKGYSGVATYIRKDIKIPTTLAYTNLCEPMNVKTTNITDLKMDDTVLYRLNREGRCMVTVHGDNLVLMNIYAPNAYNSDDASTEDMQRFVYKENFNILLRWHIKELKKLGKHVIVVGDLNVSHKIIDTCRDINDENVVEFESYSVRQWFSSLLVTGGGSLVDSFRHIHPNKPDSYTCWNEKLRSRDINYGSRIDYILIDDNLVIEDANVMQHVMGSDHCPVYCEVRIDYGGDDEDDGDYKLPLLCAEFLFDQRGKQTKMFDFFNGNDDDGDDDDDKTQQQSSSSFSKKKTKKKKRKSASSSTLTSFFHIESKETTKQPETATKTSLKRSKTTINDANSNARDLWSNLLTGKPTIPKCKCGVACTLLKAKKNTMNLGREFYCCATPQPKGCNYFIWAIDVAKHKT